jgi:Sulfatase
MPPNVLLIVLDAARADHFEPYGAPTGSTPVVAGLARRGSYVPHAYAAGSWTVPSHAALFSGLPPRAAGMSRAPGHTPQSCRPQLEALEDRLLAEVLRRAGYETRAVSTNAWLLPGSGFDTGFEQFELVDPSRDLGFGSHGRRHQARAMWEALRANVDDGARGAQDVLRRWMGESRQRPFFWFVNLVEAHSPYLPPKPFNDLGPLERVRSALEARKYLSLDSIWRASLGQLVVPAEVIERMRGLYAASIRSLDSWIGETLDALAEAHLLDDTLVIVTADHGENLGEHGMLGHSFSLDERLLRVPLVSSGPVDLDAGELLSLASLPNRLGRALDLADHPWSDPFPEGIAVAQFDPPTELGDPRNRLMLDLWGLEDSDGALMRRFTTRLTSATDGVLKLVRAGDSDEFFDLGVDPLEANPQAAPTASTAAERLHDALDLAAAPAVVARNATRAPDPAQHEDVDGLEERMRLLGYM